MDQSLITGLTIFHIIVCVLLTLTVLIQFGKGAEAGAMMGSGSSQAIFTSNSKGNFFTKMTTVLAILFMVNSITLTIFSTKQTSTSIMDGETPVASPLNNDGAMNLNNDNETSADNSEEGSEEAQAE